MKLYYWKNPYGIRNFGDDLNPWLWSKLLPEFFDNDVESIFVGIGSIINDAIPKAGRTVVFSSGTGYSGLPPVDASWKFYCVRGPLSAKALNLPKEKAVLDGAVLVKRAGFDGVLLSAHKVSFMPHVFMANECGDVLKNICNDLGVHFIDPRKNVEAVLNDIRKSEKLITEALHGAILADAYSVPWVRIRSNHMINDFKWKDWAGSLDLQIKTKRFLPIWRLKDKPDFFSTFRRRIKIKLVAKKLRAIKDGEFYLSSRNMLNKKEALLNRHFDMFVEDYAANKNGG